MYINTNAKQLVRMTLVIFSIFIINGCKSNMEITSPNTTTGGQTAKNSIISGQVINSTTGIPLDSALVYIVGQSSGQQIYETALTDIQGKYSITVSLAANTNLTIYVSKSGFVQDTTTVSVTYGLDYSVSLISLVASGSTQKPSGNPVSIYLISQSTQSIGVQGSGSVETATLTFVAVDSSGTPIDLNHSVVVNFSLGANPGGTVTPSPASVQTNDQGQASVNISSGTKAGVVQVYASINLGSKIIYSQPVALAIYGGLPDQAHFSIVPSMYNFPGYDIFNLTNPITVLVGDKYSNPVRPGTVIYFQTTSGIIDGSAITDANGVGSVNLRSGNPIANNTSYGTGFGVVTAYTADENKNMIYDSVKILFSGIAQNPVVSPTTFDIPNGGFQNFNYTVSDENGNPLAKGTTISVSVSGSNVAAQGDVAVTLPDTQSKTWTQFSFQVYDTADTVNVAGPVSVIISTNGPNGNSSTTIYGTSH